MTHCRRTRYLKLLHLISNSKKIKSRSHRENGGLWTKVLHGNAMPQTHPKAPAETAKAPPTLGNVPSAPPTLDSVHQHLQRWIMFHQHLQRWIVSQSLPPKNYSQILSIPFHI